MAKLVDIVTKFDQSRNVVTGIKTFVFDNFSAMNTDRGKDFPAMLFKPPSSNNATADASMKNWKIDFYIFDTYKPDESDVRSLAKVWEELEDLARAVIKQVLLDRTYGLTKPTNEPAYTLGYPMMNDALVGVRCQCEMRIFFDCG